MSNVIELNDKNFNEELNKTDKPVIVDFFAPWCGHCRTQSPILDDFAKESDEAVVAKINVDENRMTAAEYFITGIPAILVFKNGKLVEQKSGVQQKNDLKKLAQKHNDRNA